MRLGDFNYGSRPADIKIDSLEASCHLIEESKFTYYGEV